MADNAPPPVAEESKDVQRIDALLDDHRLYAEYGNLSMLTAEVVPVERTQRLEASADCRFVGDERILRVAVDRPSRDAIEDRFRSAFAERFGSKPPALVQIVTLRLRRIGR